jgi:hypothetical protein
VLEGLAALDGLSGEGVTWVEVGRDGTFSVASPGPEEGRNEAVVVSTSPLWPCLCITSAHSCFPPFSLIGFKDAVEVEVLSCRFELRCSREG